MPWWLKNKRLTYAAGITLVLATGFCLRYILAQRLPIINDEQAYIYDAILFNPTDPVFWKTPALITVQHVWLSTFELTSPLVPRIAMIIVALISTLLLTGAAYNVFSKSAAIATLLLGSLAPPLLSFTSVVLSEGLMLVPIAALLYLLSRVKKETQMKPIAIVGILLCLAAAVACRWSAIFWCIPTLFLLYTPNRREYARRLVWLILPCVISAGAVGVIMRDTISAYNIAGELRTFITGTQAQGMSKKISLWLLAAGRLSPFFVLAFLYPTKKRIAIKLIGLALLVGLSIIPFIASDRIPIYPGGPVTYLAGISLLLIATSFAVPQNETERYPWATLVPLALPFLVAYTIFNKVNEKYLIELLPFAILIAAVGVAPIIKNLHHVQTRLAGGITIGGIILWLLPWWAYTTQQPFAGTLSYESVVSASQYARQAKADRIMTGAVLIPLLAGQQPAFQISHPAWRLPNSPEFNQTFEPVASALEQKRIDLVFDEKLTTDTYQRHPRIKSALEKNYATVAEFKNKYGRSITALAPKQ